MPAITDRVLVCGGREYSDRRRLFAVLDLVKPSLIIAGGATGADTLAVEWAISRNVPFAVVEAEWDLYGKLAGPVRNAKMLRIGQPTLVLAFPGGTGTADMIERTQRTKIPLIKIDHHTPAASQAA